LGKSLPGYSRRLRENTNISSLLEDKVNESEKKDIEEKIKLVMGKDC